jgi:deoxyribonuclease V
MIVADYNNLSPEEAIALQKQLRTKVQLTPLQKEVTTIGGADISFNKYSETVYAGIVVLSYPALQVIHKAAVITTVAFPYIPGLLAFREVPALAQAWNSLAVKPDVLVLDGHGIAHPRRMGIATHFVIIAGIPTIGCAKSLLTGKYSDLGVNAFDTAPLISKNEIIGTVLRTKQKINPVFVSPGNLITMEESVQLIKNCVVKYRIPTPTRLAHNYVNEVRVKGTVEE